MSKRPFDPEHDLPREEVDRIRWPHGNPHELRAEIARLRAETDAAWRRGWLAGRLAATLAIAALPTPEDKP